MKIYIDDNYICHKTDETGSMSQVDSPFFDGKCDEFINGYRYVPAGATWVREDGVSFEGEMICPVTDYTDLDAAQRTNEHTALRCLGAIKIESPLETAYAMRTAIDAVISGIDDAAAENITVLFPEWTGNGYTYTAGDRVVYQDKLYKCLQNHTSQIDWAPGVAPSLWVETSNPAIEWPEWKQPTGAHDAYELGAKVTHNGNRYISKIPANTTTPGTDARWWELQL